MAKPNLAYIPATIGDKVYSILPSDGVGDFDFDRGTIATRINAQGLIETVASGENRLNYSLLDGEVVGCPHLLLEDEATNLVQYSEDFSNAYWIKTNSSVTSGFISPSGNATAYSLIEDTSTGVHFIKPPNGSFTSNSYTLSVYAKYNGRVLQIASTSTGGHYANFDLLNGVIGNSGGSTANVTMTEISNGWYRCSMTTTSNMNTAVINTVQSATSVYQESYTGDGTSGVYIWGSQVESGSFSTSYIPNYGSALGVTRAAETCNGSGNAATFNDSEGVLMAEISALVNDSDTKRISLSDGTSSNRISLYLSDETIGGVVVSGGSVGFSTSVSGYDATLNNKILFKYKENDFSIFVNGFEILTDTSGATPIGLNELRFDNGYSGNDFYGNTKQIQYFDSILDSEQLEQLTSWDSFRAMAEGQLYSVE